VQGFSARVFCKGFLQGFSARVLCKGFLQGFSARVLCKSVIQIFRRNLGVFKTMLSKWFLIISCVRSCAKVLYKYFEEKGCIILWG